MALRINGEPVEDARFAEAFARLGGFEPGLSSAREAELRRIAARRGAGQVLLGQMAAAAGFAVSTEEVSARRARLWGTSSATVRGEGVERGLAADLLIERYGEWLSRHVPRPSRAEVEHFYLRHRDRFRVPERVRAAHIVCNAELPQEEPAARARIEAAERELVAGAAFAGVAGRYSDCGAAPLGWVALGAMVPEFEQVLFTLPLGQRSGIFRTVFGFHIAVVQERRPAGFTPFEEVRPALARSLHEERRQRVVETAVEQALRAAAIEFLPEVQA